jgi:hypothetical protein
MRAGGANRGGVDDAGAAFTSHHCRWDADFADGHGFHRRHRTIAGLHRKERKGRASQRHEDVAFESGRRVTGRASDFVEARMRCRVGLAPPSESCRESSRVRGWEVDDVASQSAGLLIRRDAFASRPPSVAPSARSRGGDRRGLRPRRWDAGGLLRGLSSLTGTVYRGGCPVSALCGAWRQPEAHHRHNAVPGTPRRAQEVDLRGRCLDPALLGARWERCQAPFRGEKRARHRARVPSTGCGAGRARCRARHAPVSARSCTGCGMLVAAADRCP